MKKAFFLINIFLFTIIFSRAQMKNKSLEDIGDFIPAYENSVSGEKWTYDSHFGKDAKALLVRATDGEMYIEWETPVIPSVLNEKTVLVWLSTISHSEKVSSFKLSVNNNAEFVFSNFPSGKGDNFRIQNTGCTYSFVSLGRDKYGDECGYNILELNKNNLISGEKQKLKITSVNDNNRAAWYMLFEHKLKADLSINPQQALVNINDKIMQVFNLNFIHIGNQTEGKVFSEEKELASFNINPGKNTVEFYYPPVIKDTNLVFDVKSGDGKFANLSVKVNPVKQMNIHLIHHTHLDIGYTHRQDEVLKVQVNHIKNALEIIKRSSGNAEGEKFIWNPEALWAVEEFLRTAGKQEKEDFLLAVQDGGIYLDGFYANLMTGLCNEEELGKLFKFANELKSLYGFQINSAMITDIPGYTWGLAESMVNNNIKYFSIGPNTFDRIGHIYKFADKPFYWEAPGGKGKILCWIHGKGYSWFHTTMAIHNEKNVPFIAFDEPAILSYITDLNNSDFPYNMTVLRYNIGSDNGPCDPYLSDKVKAWNQKYITPKMIISSTNKSFTEFENLYGKNLPVLKGDMTPYWEDGAASTALETSRVRRLREKLIFLEEKAGDLKPGNNVSNLIAEAWKKVLLYNEHTWGGWNSISDPDNAFVTEQWQWKKALVDTLESIINKLHSLTESKTADNEFASFGESRYFLFNNEAELNKSKIKFSATQKLIDGKIIALLCDKKDSASPVYSDFLLKNGNFELQIDHITGDIKSFRYSGQEFVKNGKQGLNSFIYVKGQDPKNSLSAGELKSIKVKDSGPLQVTLEIINEAPGCRSLTREITLLKNLPYIFIKNTVDRLAIREKEGLHFAFPFNLEDARVKIDIPFTEIEANKDQLEVSNKNFFCMQYYADIFNNKIGVGFVSPDAPLLEVGGIFNDAKKTGWLEELKVNSEIYSYIMNNYWDTNFKADQPGLCSFEYIIVPYVNGIKPDLKKIAKQKMICD